MVIFPIVFQALAPLLKAAGAANASLPLGVSKAAVINISSILGSIETNKDGGFYPYRCSKVAHFDLKFSNISCT
jgi:NAD(P)-dependent dehydrogenase (short-subunit alcohol dehydrogenase family)